MFFQRFGLAGTTLERYFAVPAMRLLAHRRFQRIHPSLGNDLIVDCLDTRNPNRTNDLAIYFDGHTPLQDGHSLGDRKKRKAASVDRFLEHSGGSFPRNGRPRLLQGGVDAGGLGAIQALQQDGVAAVINNGDYNAPSVPLSLRFARGHCEARCFQREGLLDGEDESHGGVVWLVSSSG